MTKKDVQQLHRDCLDALNDYKRAVIQLCQMLSDCAEQKLSLDQRAQLATQRDVENARFFGYLDIRDRLVEAARRGYGNSE